MKKRKNESWDEFRKRFVIAKLRNTSLHWPARNETKTEARKERGLYECNQCKNLFRNGEFHVDHIIPVIKVTGFTNWDEYLARLLCEPHNLQILCISCHEAKTQVENHTRESHKATKRKLDKKIKKVAKDEIQ